MDRTKPETLIMVDSTAPRTHGPRPRNGFALLALLIVVAVMSITAAAIGPNLAREFRVRQIQYAVAMLEGIWTSSKTFYADVSDWPGSLSHLSQQITDIDLNICERYYGPGKSLFWKGPYLLRLVPATGLPITIGTIRNQIIRERNSGDTGGSVGGVGSPFLMILEITGVSLETAYDLNRAIDNDYTDAINGRVVWNTPDADGFVTVRYCNRIIAC